MRNNRYFGAKFNLTKHLFSIYLINTRKSIIIIKIEDIHNIIQLSGTSVILIRVCAIRIVKRRNLRTRSAIFAGLQVVTGLEQEALHVIRGVVIDPEHGEELAVVNGGAFVLARTLVRDVVEEHVDHVVQGHGAGPVCEWAVVHVLS